MLKKRIDHLVYQRGQLYEAIQQLCTESRMASDERAAAEPRLLAMYQDMAELRRSVDVLAGQDQHPLSAQSTTEATTQKLTSQLAEKEDMIVTLRTQLGESLNSATEMRVQLGNFQTRITQIEGLNRSLEIRTKSSGPNKMTTRLRHNIRSGTNSK